MAFEARINDPDFHKVVYLDEQGDALRLTINDPDGDAIVVELDDRGVTDLRRALQRYERGRK